MSELPKLPRFDLLKIEARRDRIASLLNPFVGDLPQQETLYAIADVLAVTFHLEHRSTGLIETVRSLPNSALTERAIYGFAWRLAARFDDLQAGRPVRPWTAQSRPEWIAFEILDAEHGRDRFDQWVETYWLQALTGTACPRVIQKTWSAKQVRYLSRMLGFTPRNGQLPFADALQLVRLRLAGLVEPERSKNGPDFFQVACPPSFLDHNKTILRARIRRNPPCPDKFVHQCHFCPIGYDRCMAATHPATFRLDWCGNCNEQSFFDPAVDQDLCVRCYRARKLRKKKHDLEVPTP